jgi:hypothetical protein
MEEALERGQCDVIMIGRPLLSDPDLPKKLEESRLDDIRNCIRCAQCYEIGVIKGFQLRCAITQSLNERDYAIKRRSLNSREFSLLKGGPGGLEAARVAAMLGHEVTLMEKEGELGGYARIASIPTGKGEIKTYFLDWLERQCGKGRRKIRT